MKKHYAGRYLREKPHLIDVLKGYAFNAWIAVFDAYEAFKMDKRVKTFIHFAGIFIAKVLEILFEYLCIEFFTKLGQIGFLVQLRQIVCDWL